MLDKWTLKLVKPPLLITAKMLSNVGVTANQVSIAGFVVGMLALPLLSFQLYLPTLFCILINRISDGLDGSLARLTTPTDGGAFLDITLDFVFYSAVVFGFALADPVKNSLAAAALIFAFVGTGATFLAFGIMAERKQILSISYPNKGFYYLNGLAEGTETIAFLVLFCLFPHYFPVFAWIFAVICYISTAIRIISGYATLQKLQ